MHHQAGVHFENFTEVKFRYILLTGTYGRSNHASRVWIDKNHTISLTLMTWHIREQTGITGHNQGSRLKIARCTIQMDVGNSTELNFTDYKYRNYQSWNWAKSCEEVESKSIKFQSNSVKAEL